MELRCDERIHGVIDEDRFVVKCRSKRCGAQSGTIVFHHFNLGTGELIETQRFRDPAEIIHRATIVPMAKRA